MNKTTNSWLMAALVCGLSLGVTACSDDDDKNDDAQVSVVTIDSDIISHGVETDMRSAVIEVPVKCDGEWTATLAKNTNWARIEGWKVSYDGNQTLTLLVDENLTKSDRATTLTIGNGEDYQRITVRQNYNYNGEAPTNGSGLAFAMKGLGTGMDYDYALNVKSKENTSDRFDPTKVHGLNNIFNITKIEALIKNNSLLPSAYVEAPIPLADLEASFLDSALVQSKHLKIALELEVSFGIIEFSANATYNSTKEEGRAYVDYTICRNAPMYNVYLSPAELATYAFNHRNVDDNLDDEQYKKIDQLIAKYQKLNERRKVKNLNEDGLTEAQQAEIDAMYAAIETSSWDFAGIFSTNFAKRYNELYNAIERTRLTGKQTDTAAADATMQALDNEYGPFFIAGGNFGGAMVVHCKVDTMRLDGAAKFEGSISGGMGGLFNVSGAFDYTEEGFNRLRDINPNILIVGGSANEVADQMISMLMSKNPDDLQAWQDTLKGWLASMYSDDSEDFNSSEATPISFTITPIWTLFNETAIQAYVQNWFMTKYKDRGIEGYSNIMYGNMGAPGADQLLNKDSEWWQRFGK